MKSLPYRHFLVTCLRCSADAAVNIVFVPTGGPSHTRRQRVRHDRQAGSSGRADRAVSEPDVGRGPRLQTHVPVPNERFPERSQTDAVWRSKSNTPWEKNEKTIHIILMERDQKKLGQSFFF